MNIVRRDHLGTVLLLNREPRYYYIAVGVTCRKVTCCANARGSSSG